MPGPASLRPESFAEAYARLARTTHMARRNHLAPAYLRRGVGRCGQCQWSGMGRTRPPGSPYAGWRGRIAALRAARGDRCPHERQRAHGGAGRP
jgi:hypothetical protein